MPEMNTRWQRTTIVLGAVFAAAAFLCSLPYCWDYVYSWPSVLAYVAAACSVVFTLTIRPRGAGMYCLVLFLIALALRAAWALHASFPPTGDDYEYYRSVSLELLRGQWNELFQTFWPWGYFLYLAGLARLFGPSLMVPVAVNSIAGAATSLLVYVIARRFFEERAARIAGGIYALWPGVVYWSGVLCTEIPHLVLFLGALLCLLRGLQAKSAGAAWALAGGLMAALSEFFRPLTPLLLIPYLLYSCGQGDGSSPGGRLRRRGRRKDAGLALAAYAVCLGILLTGESVASGRPNMTTSHTMGINLAFGLNWESRGMFNVADAQFMLAEDPLEVNRRGFQLARERLRTMGGRNWWRLPVLAAWKFPVNWSLEAAGLDATYAGVPESRKESHWLTTFQDELSAVAQYFHAGVLALAAVGFWRNRRAWGLALPAGILIAFALLHAVFEVDCRYHFCAQSLLAVAGAGAFARCAKARIAGRDVHAVGPRQ